MNIGSSPEWLIKLVIVIALPGAACFRFYSISHLDNPDSLTIFLIVLAYPAILLASIGLAGPIKSRQVSKTRLLWSLMLILPALFLAYLWL